MKKTLKSMIFLILSAVLIFSVFTVGSFAQDKSIIWNYGDDVYQETYYYGGELKLGENKVSPLADADEIIFGDCYDDNVYYEFDVEQSGYYDFEAVSDAYYSIYISQDIRDGIVYGDKELLITDDEGFSVYLEEGECIVGLIFYYYDWNGLGDIYNSELNIEFIGSEITDMQIEEEYLEDLILGYHIGSEYDENNTADILAEGKLVFNSGKELEFYEYLNAEYPEDIAPGENVITFVLPGYKKEYTVQIKTVDDYIKNVEVGNIDDMTVVKQTFMPDVVFTPDVNYIELIITNPDGTKKTEIADYDYMIELKGDKYIWISYDYIQKDDGKWYFTVEAMNKEYLSVPCETVQASFEENLGLYFNCVLEYAIGMVGETSWYLTDAFDLSLDLSVKERTELLSDAFSEIGNYYSEVYKITEMFMNFVF